MEIRSHNPHPHVAPQNSTYLIHLSHEMDQGEYNQHLNVWKEFRLGWLKIDRMNPDTRSVNPREPQS